MKRYVLVMFLVSVFGSWISAETLRFFYETGDQYRIVTQVDEDVYINGVFSHRADILNRIAVEVTEALEGAGRLNADFLVSERTAGSGTAYQWSSEYSSEFVRDERGHFEIGPEYIMPTVRDVPMFPDRDLVPGESWSAEAEEVHDFTENFNMTEPLRFPVQVFYTYLGNEEVDGRELAVISIRYSVFHRTGAAPDPLDLTPARISGMSDQVFYWDTALGLPHSYSESFDILLELASGDTVEYIGTASGVLYPSETMNRSGMAEEIRRDLEENGIEDVEVDEAEEGVTLRLKNIQFMPDSSVLVSTERVKLDAIADILAGYPDRDILVTGHTALARTAELRQRLSEERARIVADYLIATGCRAEDQVITRGMGATVPLADNATEEGRALNRRVEITILEN